MTSASCSWFVAARPFRAVVVGATLMGVLAACGGEDTASGGVAALDESSSGGSRSASPTASGDVEQQLLDYVECLRGEGLDVPDPTVDAEGNLTLRPQGGAGGGVGQIDPEQLQSAQQTCGQPPAGALGITEEDRSELQDAALEFAKCMRGEGIDVPDPDFSQGGLGAGGQGPFGDLDTDDPKVAAAVETCQSALSDALPGGGQ